MSVRQWAVAAAVSLAVNAAPLAGQAPGHATHMTGAAGGGDTIDSATTAFLARAREGTRRYQSQEAAIADGYRRVGVGFPAMGEHWVNASAVLGDTLIAERPAVLIYVDVGGEPRLAGVAYTDLLRPGEVRPVFPAPGMWHEHNGTVADESFPLNHGDARAMLASDGGAELRLAVLHAWIWTPNPRGVFSTDNWSLPFVRLGIPAADGVPREVLQALALALDDEGYLLLTLRTGLGLTVDEEDAASTVLATRRTLAKDEAAAIQAAGQLTAEESARLAALWAETWPALERALPARAAALRQLRAQLAGHG